MLVMLRGLDTVIYDMYDDICGAMLPAARILKAEGVDILNLSKGEREGSVNLRVEERSGF